MAVEKFFYNITALNASKVAVVSLVVCVSTGCQSINFKKVAYNALRHEDCLRNEHDDFCTRGYLEDFQEYDRLRTEYLANTRGDRESENIETVNPWAKPTQTTNETELTGESSTAL